MIHGENAIFTKRTHSEENLGGCYRALQGILRICFHYRSYNRMLFYTSFQKIGPMTLFYIVASTQYTTFQKYL